MLNTMSRTKSGGHLGRSLIKEKNKSKKSGRREGSWLHSSEVDDGYEWGRLNLQSVTEESRLDEFLSTAQLAGTEFTAEKLNIKFVDPGSYTGLPSAEERREMEQTQQENKQFLNIPRRPEWDSSTTAEQLDQLERDNFLKWRRQLAVLQENEKLLVTPFERNLEFWRQLWRVIERSNVVVQIVDARNPLLFRCEDLEKYVKEIDSKKVNMLLISKADLLTSRQRQAWKEYFEAEGSIKVAFWSALAQSSREEESHSDSASESATKGETTTPIERVTTDLGQIALSDDTCAQADLSDASTDATATKSTATDKGGDKSSDPTNQMSDLPEVTADCNVIPPTDHTPNRDVTCPEECLDIPIRLPLEGGTDLTTRLLSREELIQQLLSISPVPEGQVTTVGMVGYPNVGKSSTINALFQGKKVPVSATPGRTKHFQTLYVSEKLMLCDCPGLVFPNFVSSKAEMICNGILPIDQMRDHVPPVSLVCQRIPRPLLEATYGIRLTKPREGEDPNRVPHAHELLEAYGYMRGFMTQHGRPDNPRSARYILKDYVNGKLLYSHPPPGVDASLFNDQLADRVSPQEDASDLKQQNDNKLETSDGVVATVRSEFDEAYFQQDRVRAIIKGGHGAKDFIGRAGGLNDHNSHSAVGNGSNVPESDGASFTSLASSDAGGGKPWKKHHNRNKKEKIKRTHKA